MVSWWEYVHNKHKIEYVHAAGSQKIGVTYFAKMSIRQIKNYRTNHTKIRTVAA